MPKLLLERSLWSNLGCCLTGQLAGCWLAGSLTGLAGLWGLLGELAGWLAGTAGLDWAALADWLATGWLVRWLGLQFASCTDFHKIEHFRGFFKFCVHFQIFVISRRCSTFFCFKCWYTLKIRIHFKVFKYFVWFHYFHAFQCLSWFSRFCKLCIDFLFSFAFHGFIEFHRRCQIFMFFVWDVRWCALTLLIFKELLDLRMNLSGTKPVRRSFKNPETAVDQKNV